MEAFDMWTKLLLRPPVNGVRAAGTTFPLPCTCNRGCLYSGSAAPPDFSVEHKLNQEARAKQSHKTSTPPLHPGFVSLSPQVCFLLWGGETTALHGGQQAWSARVPHPSEAQLEDYLNCSFIFSNKRLGW